jgi:hypothetical protein
MRGALSLALALMLWAGTAMALEHAPAASRFGAQHVVPDTARVDHQVTYGNAIWMTGTNYGFFGDNFVTSAASLEYPGGYEHLVRGGLWVGALATDGNGDFIGVTCGAVDGPPGQNSFDATEWTPSGMGILERSTLPGMYYDPHAVSEMDFVSTYNDMTPCLVGTEAHRPMRFEVRQETHQWSRAEYANLLFVHLTITNRGPLLRNAWVGLYSELASGCKKCYVSWPPNSSDASGMGSYYAKKLIVFDGSLALEREHYCRGYSAPPGDPETGCRYDVAPYWMGLKYLGARGVAGDTTTRRLSFSAWSWSPGNLFRDEDVERYALMSTGLIQPISGDSLLPSTGDPVEVFSVGPFPQIDPDSSICVDYVFVGGAATEDIQANARFAQRVYDSGMSPLVSVEPPGQLPGPGWFALLGVSPNPTRSEALRVSFALGEAGPVRIEVFDVSGRRVEARDLGSLEPGPHVARIERVRSMRPGTYFVRLRQGGRSASLRTVVLE